MPFDAKLIHPDEPPLDAAGELNLPADFAALGEQLRDAAVHLAGRYPAEPRVGQSLGASKTSRRALVLIASTLATGLLAAVIVWQTQPGQPRTRPVVAVSEPVPGPVSPARRAAAVSASAVSVSLTELSGPELEALLDLVSRDPQRVSNISF
jgi:hypothetical protein